MSEEQPEYQEPLVPPTPPSVPEAPRHPRGVDFAIGIGLGLGIWFLAGVLMRLTGTTGHIAGVLAFVLPSLLAILTEIGAVIYCFRIRKRPYIAYGLLTILGISLIPLLLVGACLLVARGI